MAGVVSELKFLVPWGHIAAKAWGKPQGRPVLCLHGWLDNANTFNKLIPLLPKDCFYMAIDFAGHGLSSHRPAGFPYHFFDYVTDVRRIVAELKWNRFSIMGHSLGGTVAGMFSCVFPELVDKLILVESYGFYPAPTGFHRGPGLNRQKKSNSLPIARDGRSHVEESNQLLVSKRKLIEGLLSFEAKQEHSSKVRSPQAALQRLLEANTHLTEESGTILLERGATEVPGGLVYNRDMRVILHNHSLVTLDHSMNFMKKIQADILMVIAKGGIFTGEFEDSKHFIQPLRKAYKSILKERFQLIEVAGNHFVHMNEPEIVAGIISAFLNKHQKPKASL